MRYKWGFKGAEHNLEHSWSVTAACVLSWGGVNGERRSFSGTERFHPQTEAAIIPNSPEIYIRKSRTKTCEFSVDHEVPEVEFTLYPLAMAPCILFKL